MSFLSRQGAAGKQASSPMSTDNPYQGDPFLSNSDNAKKRRSVSCDNSRSGRAFINPIGHSVKAHPRRSFFLDSNSPDDSDSLLSVANLTSSQAFRVARSLNLSPPNQQSLIRFVGQILPADEQMIERVKSAIESVLHPEQSTPPPSSPQTIPLHCISDFMDCRYSSIPSATPICFLQIAPGQPGIDYSFQLPPFPDGVHAVMYSIMASVNPPIFGWSQSLRVIVNGIQIKAPGQFGLPIIDLSQIGRLLTVRILSGCEHSSFSIVVQRASYVSYEGIVLALQNEDVQPESFSPLDVSLYCPITGNLLKHPGRGKDCKHNNCFELEDYLKICNISKKWICPICHCSLPISSLIYSHLTKNIIYQLSTTAEPARDMTTIPQVNVVKMDGGDTGDKTIFDTKTEGGNDYEDSWGDFS